LPISACIVLKPLYKYRYCTIAIKCTISRTFYDIQDMEIQSMSNRLTNKVLEHSAASEWLPAVDLFRQNCINSNHPCPNARLLDFVCGHSSAAGCLKTNLLVNSLGKPADTSYVTFKYRDEEFVKRAA
jgi:hypothetical protein